jgi:phosphoribosylamine--glycine ligase
MSAAGEQIRALVVGGGGREHCIVEALKRSGADIYVVAANRNPGISRAAKDFLLHDVMDVERIATWAEQRSIDLAIVGPEAPLGAGIVDKLDDVGISAFGPNKSASQIELSKEFARNLMRDNGIPGLIDFWAFSNAKDFESWVKSCDFEFVIKPIGLTGGKGVKVWGDHFNSKDEASVYVNEILKDRIGGAARFLIEEKAVGEEFSLQAFSDGEDVIPMPLAQDHKRAYEGDEGPNTGGMGSYSDSDHLLPFVTREDYEKALDIMKKTVKAMKANGTPFRGCLYGGFTATKSGPKVLEFNARFADPECMNVLPILESDFAEVCESAATGSLPKDVRFAKKATVCKYVVPEGYGTKSLSGMPVEVDEKAIARDGAELFWATVDEREGKTYTMSSRSLAVVGIEDTLEKAEQVAETALRHVQGRIYVRHDIGKKEVLARKVRRMAEIRQGIVR